MSLIWIICGAGRGVGKTTLALKLCEVLANSVYAKCGHSKAKAGKPDNFFNKLADLESFIETCEDSYEHIVAESNTLALRKRGGIIIFIDGVTGKTNFREDREQLFAAADLRIGRGAESADWEKVLAAKFDSKGIRKAICQFLAAQKRFLFGSEPMVRSKVWFESAGEHVFGNGLARLLENVSRSGTLLGAAKAADMSYRYAWNLIGMAEEHFGKTLIDRHAGGKCGGGSALSPAGSHLLAIFKQLDEEVADFADERFLKLYNKDKIDAGI